jgi:hypothetical protein
MITLKLNTYIFTPLLGKGGLCPYIPISQKGMNSDAKNPGGWPANNRMEKIETP